MQEVIGGLVLLAVLLFSAAVATKSARSVFQWAMHFVLSVLGGYLTLGLLLAFIWAIAWFGVLIREVLMWLIEAVLMPFNWVIPGG